MENTVIERLGVDSVSESDVMSVSEGPEESGSEGDTFSVNGDTVFAYGSYVLHFPNGVSVDNDPNGVSVANGPDSLPVSTNSDSMLALDDQIGNLVNSMAFFEPPVSGATRSADSAEPGTLAETMTYSLT